MEYIWDEQKYQSNLEKHGLDFVDIEEVLKNKILIKASPKNNEERYLMIGYFERGATKYPVSIVYTPRGKDTIRIISFRIARKKEREIYKKIHNITI
ncbi:BrnT family toxin [Candidatus Peregrinibacteria bacterium]|jgi:uncharacterized protein|nr:BrnT family toxin [Candidatus Peregrinibacteria bacterium]